MQTITDIYHNYFKKFIVYLNHLSQYQNAISQFTIDNIFIIDIIIRRASDDNYIYIIQVPFRPFTYMYISYVVKYHILCSISQLIFHHKDILVT